MTPAESALLKVLDAAHACITDDGACLLGGLLDGRGVDLDMAEVSAIERLVDLRQSAPQPHLTFPCPAA